MAIENFHLENVLTSTKIIRALASAWGMTGWNRAKSQIDDAQSRIDFIPPEYVQGNHRAISILMAYYKLLKVFPNTPERSGDEDLIR